MDTVVVNRYEKIPYLSSGMFIGIDKHRDYVDMFVDDRLTMHTFCVMVKKITATVIFMAMVVADELNAAVIISSRGSYKADEVWNLKDLETAFWYVASNEAAEFIE